MRDHRKLRHYVGEDDVYRRYLGRLGFRSHGTLMLRHAAAPSPQRHSPPRANNYAGVLPRVAVLTRLLIAGVLTVFLLAGLLLVQAAVHAPPPLNPAQKAARKEGFELCYGRIIANAQLHNDAEWETALRAFERCMVQLGVPGKATYEPWEKKWRFDYTDAPVR